VGKQHLGALLLGLILGCAGAAAPAFIPLQPIPDGRAVVYVYRSSTPAQSTEPFEVFVNGRHFADLPDGTYVQLVTRPGRLLLRARPGPDPAIAARSGVTPLLEPVRDGVVLQVAAGEIHYVRFRLAMGTAATPEMLLEPESVALTTLQSCRPASPLGEDARFPAPIPVR
jgi:hypothetical protein